MPSCSPLSFLLLIVLSLACDPSLCPRPFSGLGSTLGTEGCEELGVNPSVFFSPLSVGQEPDACLDDFVLTLEEWPQTGYLMSLGNQTFCYASRCGFAGEEIVTWSATYRSCPSVEIDYGIYRRVDLPTVVSC